MYIIIYVYLFILYTSLYIQYTLFRPKFKMYVSQKGWFNVLKIDYPPVGRSKSQVPRSPANHRALALGSQVAEGGLVCFSGVGRGQTPIIRKI